MNSKTVGTPKVGKNTPRHKDDNTRHTKDGTNAGRPTKADLLARMKAASEAQKSAK